MNARWNVVGASVIGTSHARGNKPCQDFSLWRILPDGILISAVADGAGSASHAEAGAEAACRSVLGFLEVELAKPDRLKELENLVKDAFKTAREAVRAEAEKLAVTPRDLASTLSIFIGAKQWSLAAQIGDGAVVAQAPDGSLECLTRPVVSEFLNETVFLTGEDSLEKLQITTRPHRCLAMGQFSDGLQMLALKMPEATPHEPFFRPLLAFIKSLPEDATAEPLKSFLNSPRITARTDDDLTLVLAAGREE